LLPASLPLALSLPLPECERRLPCAATTAAWPTVGAEPELATATEKLDDGDRGA